MSEVHYIYDGNVVIQERNAFNLPQVSYTRTSNRLLARSEATGLTPIHAYFHTDGNGNVTVLIDRNQTIVAKYTYDPFGNTLSKSGSLADANLYRFASQELHSNSGLIYFARRFYDPNLQRWLNRDPIQEQGGINLYTYLRNSPFFFIELLGLAPVPLTDAQQSQIVEAIIDISNRAAAISVSEAGRIYADLMTMLNQGKIYVETDLSPNDAMRASKSMGFNIYIQIEPNYLDGLSTIDVGRTLAHEYDHAVNQFGSVQGGFYEALDLVGAVFQGGKQAFSWLTGNGWDSDAFYENRPSEIMANDYSDLIYSNEPIPFIFPADFVGPLLQWQIRCPRK